jgi:predicted mannosyl-3-phosphoglycerate phosphatase (HAD superfamily)
VRVLEAAAGDARTTINDLHNEIARAKLSEIKTNQHWNAIRMLFAGELRNDKPEVKATMDKAVQVEAAKKDSASNTDEIPALPMVAEELPVVS